MNKNQNEVQKTGHIYDGIEELDNPAPNWFQMLFIVTIFFGVGYAFYYWISNGPNQITEYKSEQTADEQNGFKQTSTETNKPVTESELNQAFAKAEVRSAGLAIFNSKCISCHGNHAQGGIGPNLTDPYWIHGAKLSDILNVISKGVPDKGMPPWGALLKRDEIISLTIFVKSTKDTHPADPKAPQGVFVTK